MYWIEITLQVRGGLSRCLVIKESRWVVLAIARLHILKSRPRTICEDISYELIARAIDSEASVSRAVILIDETIVKRVKGW